MTFANITLLVTAFTTALIAGLFYAYSCSVNAGLGKLPDAGYLAAMQSINREILNPLFFMSFMGTLVLLPVSTWLQYSHPASMRFYFLLAATLVYAIGTFGVTIMGNVPLNNALDAFNIQAASPEGISEHRAQFEKPWNQLHRIRTIANAIALILVLMACIIGQSKQSNESKEAKRQNSQKVVQSL
ncbi:anthrone oxygenase family protein [Longitalea arenae]|uniref:anthrone oxygenase family protein n=1 Tax=Longitalea arenae TaxID=2812558 RepID=UPI001967ADDB|nr:anthrone oxygenase family protein [Longitalea arenae]